jgi:type II secretory pathway pseudopilin PulG
MFNHGPHSREGFTLIELLIFSAIFSLIIGAFITILISITDLQVQQSAGSDVAQQGEFLVQQLQYYIQNARLVDMPQDVGTSTLTLRESTSSFDPTIFSLATGTVYLKQGLSGAAQQFTSNKVTVSNLSFTRHFNLNSSSSAYGVDSVSYSFTMGEAGANQSKYSQTFRSSAAVLQPVGKIALIQIAKFESNSASNVSSIVLPYATANNAGSMLFAYFVDTGVVSSTITDSNGNTWIYLGNQLYDNNVLGNIYMAINANAGMNTTTVTFNTGATFATVYIFEYRGASTSSPLDMVTANIRYATSTPTTDFVNPTSTAELVLTLAYNESTSEVPVPTNGFVMESSSTFNPKLYIADKDQYINGPVAGSWQYMGTPNTVVGIITFK